jgi:lipoate-protein ligase A
MRPCYYLETASHDPFYNLAFEEYVLTHKTEGDYLILWQNENTIVVGQNQNTEEEINRPFVESHHINVVRRMTGGGAVYHDLGNLNYSFITDAKDASQLSISRFTIPVIQALSELGLYAEASGRNDILVNGKKVSGTAQRLWENRILHHGTLLFDSDPAMLSGALRVNAEKFQSKSVKSVASRVGNIRDYLPVDMDLEAFWAFLRRHIYDGVIDAKLTNEELNAVREIKIEKYDTWEWNYGKSPVFDVINRQRFNGGTLEVRLSIKNGRIADIAFFGDFLSRKSLAEIIEALKECPFRKADIEKSISHFELEDYFGAISKDEIINLIFC